MVDSLGIPAEALQETLDHFAAHGPSDIHPLAPEMELLLRSTPESVRRILQEVEYVNWNDPQEYAPPLIGHLEIGEGQFRKALYLDPLLDVLLTSLVNVVAPAIECVRLPCAADTVFSYRWMNKGGVWFDPEVGWTAFVAEQRKRIADSKFTGVTDIGHFYQSIRMTVIEDALQYAGVTCDQQRTLVNVLRLCRVEEFGLPVGGAASRILAEACLSPIDRALCEEGIGFVRFVDDYRFFADSKQELQAALLRLTRKLSAIGLGLNKNKTKLLDSVEYAEQLSVKPAATIDKNALDSLNVVIDKFDPYSQLVGQRVAELQAVSSSRTLCDALTFEFEKLEPSYRSLKVMLAALQFALPEELAQSLTQVMDFLATGKLNRLAPTLERVIAARYQDLPPDFRDRFAQLLWRHFDNAFRSTPDATLALYTRMIGHLSSSLNPEDLRQRIQTLNVSGGSLILQRELIRLELLGLTGGDSATPPEYLSAGDPWRRGLCLALGAEGPLELPGSTALERIVRHLR